MKKIILIIIMLLTISSVKASTNDSEVRIEWIPNVYYNYEVGGITYWGQLGYIYANNIISYCYDIEKTITTNVYSSTSNVSLKGNGMLVAFFGYGYESNNTLEDYMATQELIWKSQGKNVYFTTSSEGRGNIIDITTNKNKILALANSYGKFPKFNDLFKFDLGTTNIIKDTKNILKNYEVRNVSSNVLNIENDSLIIKTNSKGTYKFDLVTKYDVRFKNKKFTAENSQTIIQIGMINDMYDTYSYSVSGGDLSINLYDKITNSIENIGSTSFKGNIFNIYDSKNKLVGTYESLEDGKVFIDNLDIGKYRLEHLNISEGYKKDKTIYEFELSFNDTHKVINIYLEPISIDVNIKKTYGNPIVGTIYNDNDVTFVIKDKSGNMIKELVTDEFGECTTTINYGEYIVSQTTTNNIDKISEDFIINKIDFDKNYNIVINDIKYNAKLKVHLYESGSTIPIENAKFIINENEYITNNEGYFITESFDEGTVILQEIVNEGYYEIDDIEVLIDENSNFYLDGNDVYIDVVVYNEKIPVKVVEEIKEETKQEVINKDLEEVIDDTSNSKPIVKEEIIDNNVKFNKDAIEEAKNEEIVDEKEVSITKLPNLGITDFKFLYIGVLLFRYKRVKENNM